MVVEQRFEGLSVVFCLEALGGLVPMLGDLMLSGYSILSCPPSGPVGQAVTSLFHAATIGFTLY